MAEVCMDWIFWIRTPAASNRIRIEVFFAAARSGLYMNFVFGEKNVTGCLLDLNLCGF